MPQEFEACSKLNQPRMVSFPSKSFPALLGRGGGEREEEGEME